MTPTRGSAALMAPAAGPPQGGRAPPRGAEKRRSRKLGGSSLAALDRGLPLLDEFQALGLVEVGQELGSDRDRAQRRAQRLGQACKRLLTLDVGADRAELGLV